MNSKMKQIISIGSVTMVLVILLGVSSGYAFDGKRKGFVLGFGLGVAPTAKWTNNLRIGDVSGTGYSVNFLIGYAWNDRNMLVYEAKGVMFKSSSLNDKYSIQGLDCAQWYHYWGMNKRKLFTSVGLGRMILGTQYCDIDGEGLGYSIGGGYEFMKQVQIGLFYMGGHTSNDLGLKANHYMLNVLITVVAY
jgi:hypothetical protein